MTENRDAAAAKGVDRLGNEFCADGVGALQRIDHTSPAGRDLMESVFQNQLNDANRAKWTRGLQHFENASYLLGNHLTRYFFAGQNGLGLHTFGVHDKNPYDSVVAKVADNQLLRPVETVVGMLTEQAPMPRAEPNSDSVEDEDAAELSEVLVKLTFENPLNMPLKIQEAIQNAMITGHAIAEVEYTKTGLPVEVPLRKMVQKENPFYVEGESPPSEKMIKTEEYVPGRTEIEIRKDMVCRLWTPFHFDVDPAATRPEDASWFMRSSYEDIDYIREEFDKDDEGYFKENLDALTRQNAEHHILYWWSRFQDILETPQYFHHTGGFTPGTRYLPGGQAPNQTLFTVVDVRPSIQYPRGRTLIFAGGKILYAGNARAWSSKYPWRWHPYAFLPWFKMPGKFWGVPLLTFLVPLQKKINAIDALVHANRQYLSIGQWLIPKHSKIAEGKFSAMHGEQFTYIDTPGGNKPEKIGNVPLSPELIGEREQLIRSIEHIAASGVVDMQAIGRSAARAGTMLDFMRQEKLRSKAPLFKYLESFLETIGQNILIEYQLNLIEEDTALTARLQQALREHDSLSIQHFVGASLRDHHAITIDIASELMHSPEAKQARAMEWLQYSAGLQFLEPQEREALRKVAGIDKLMKNVENTAVRRARRMIARIIRKDFDAAQEIPQIDVPRAMVPVFRKAILEPRFEEYTNDVKMVMMHMFDVYSKRVAAEDEAMMAQRVAMAEAGVQMQ
ncbi:MAG: hypothetical protein ACYTFQ_00090 [Planctomycetota bacterium]|jgi:hypothetical protein